MGHPAGDVISVAAVAEIDIVAGGGFRVLQEAAEEGNAGVPLAHEAMAQLVKHSLMA